MRSDMRKPTYSEVYAYKNMYWFAFAVFVFMPVLCDLILRTVYLYVETNIAYQWMVTPLSVLMESLSVISVYAGYGILTYCVLYFGKNAAGVIRLAFITHAVSFLVYCIAYYFFTGELLAAIFVIFSEQAVRLLVTFVIYRVLLSYGKRKGTFMNIDRYELSPSIKGHQLTKGILLVSAVYGAVQLFFLVYQMTVDFLDPSLGPPILVKEYVYWILEYVYIFLFFALGVVIMAAVGIMAQKLKDSGKAKFTAK